jgi:hypothetical protein
MTTTNGDNCVSLMQGTLVRPIARYPSSVAADAALKIAANRVQTTLRGSIGTGDTIITVSDASRLVPDMLLSADSEILSISSISGNNLTVVRGFDGTVPACHSSGTTLRAEIDAWHHNALAAEITAIEQALGPNLSNISSTDQGIRSTAYNFGAQTPGGSLIVGSNVVTLTPVPQGVNGTDPHHYLYVSGGTGTPEPCRIIGGTAIGGSPTGTVIIQCAFTHSGNWTIRSATAGIAEAVQVIQDPGGIVHVPAGTHTIYGTTCVHNKQGVRILGDGFYGTWIQTTYTGGTLFMFEQTGGGAAGGNSLEYMTIVGPNNPAATNYAVSVDGQVSWFLRYVNISQVANGVRIVNNVNSDMLFFEHVVVSYFNGIAYNILGANSQTFNHCSAIRGTDVTSIGWQVTRTGALVVQGGYSFHVGYGMLINPDEFAANLWVTDFNADTSSNDGIRIVPSGSGFVESAVFVNTWTCNGQGNGVYMGTVGASSRIESVQFLGHRAIINSYAGFVITGTKVKDITISNGDIAANSTASPNASDGIFIVPAADGPDGITIVNNTIGSHSGHITFHRFAINFGFGAVAGATDNVVVTGNRFGVGDFITLGGQIRYIEGLDIITGKNIMVKDNMPDETVVRTAPEASGTVNLGGSGGEMYTTAGTGTVSYIRPAWNGRKVLLTKTDATGPKIFNTVGEFRNTLTLNDGETVTAFYDGTKWNLTK